MESEFEESLNIRTESNWIVSIFEILSETPTEVVILLSLVIVIVSKLGFDAYVKTSNKRENVDGDTDINTTSIPLTAFMTLVNEREKNLDTICAEIDDLKKVDQIQNEIAIIKEDILHIKEQLDTFHKQRDEQSDDPSPPDITTI